MNTKYTLLQMFLLFNIFNKSIFNIYYIIYLFIDIFFLFDSKA